MCNKEIISRYIVMNELDPSIELHTFAEWKRLGYKVKKGEEVETQNYFLKLSAFFTREQVEKSEVY